MPGNKQGSTGKVSTKRYGSHNEISTKKRKLLTKSSNTAKKLKASERSHVPIPNLDNENRTDEEDLDEEDLAFFAGNNTGFLEHLDPNAISRSKKEQARLHKLQKPTREKQSYSDLPPVDDHESDADSWSSGIGHDLSGPDEDKKLSHSDDDELQTESDDLEQAYEKQPRKRASSQDKDMMVGPARLPIKLPDGTLKHTGHLPARIVDTESSSESDNESVEMEDWSKDDPRKRAGIEDIATGARFGRPAVVDVIANGSRKARIQGAKEQLAGICQDIIADPENGLGLLRRLHTFSLRTITTPSHPKPITNDPIIRKLAFLSQLAVFKDIIPGYRIRPLTDLEKAEKASQMVVRTREYEQGLVGVYQGYLQTLDEELKAKNELADVALQCMCTLLAEATHFNFRVNVMSAIVGRLSKRSWDSNSELCLESLIAVFRDDRTGVASLEIMRLMNRMIKERHFRVHPNTLSCLLHLRLRNELSGIRASGEKVTREEKENPKIKSGKRKGKDNSVPYLSKTAKKALKEKKEIEKEMQEAAAEVDKEDRAKQQTETLKLLFVLYFRILKNPRPTPLLSGALEGLARFAHLVNIDFFGDLLSVLKGLVQRTNERDPDATRSVDGGIQPEEPFVPEAELLRQRLLCISTAFELLSGQGEAINIDLRDFINYLYAIIIELTVSPDIEDVPSEIGSIAASKGPRPSKVSSKSTADLLFRTLSLVFNSRSSSSSSNPPWRTAAFAKRLMISCLSWPPATVRRTMEFIETLMIKEPRLEALLSTDDRTADGIYRADIDDPQLSNPFGASFWELRMLGLSHWDQNVRLEAGKLANFVRS